MVWSRTEEEGGRARGQATALAQVVAGREAGRVDRGGAGGRNGGQRFGDMAKAVAAGGGSTQAAASELGLVGQKSGIERGCQGGAAVIGSGRPGQPGQSQQTDQKQDQGDAKTGFHGGYPFSSAQRGANRAGLITITRTAKKICSAVVAVLKQNIACS